MSQTHVISSQALLHLLQVYSQGCRKDEQNHGGISKNNDTLGYFLARDVFTLGDLLSRKSHRMVLNLIGNLPFTQIVFQLFLAAHSSPPEEGKTGTLPQQDMSSSLDTMDLVSLFHWSTGRCLPLSLQEVWLGCMRISIR